MEDTHIDKDIKNTLMHNTILLFIKFNNLGTQHLNGPRCLIYSAAIPCVYLSPSVYVSPALNLVRINMVYCFND